MALPRLNAPKYTMVVPSKMEEVSFRPYLVKEEKILMMASESKDEKQMIAAMKELISACTFGAVDAEQLTMFDLEYMFVKIRAKSVGETSRVKLTCECEHKNEVEFNLDGVKVEGVQKTGTKIELDEGVGLIMRYPTVNELMDLGNGDDVEKMMGMIRASIESIYTPEELFNVKEQTKEEVDGFIDSLSSQQFQKIREYLEGVPTTTVKVDYACGSCGKENEIVLTGVQNFFS